MASRGNTLPFSLKAPILRERDLHVLCADFLDRCLKPPAMWAPYPAGVTQLTPQQHAQYSRFRLKRGFPDALIFALGKVWGIELKTKRGRLSKTRVGRTQRGAPRILEGQEDVFPKLLATGAFGAIEVVRSVDEMVDLLELWGIPLQGTLSERKKAWPADAPLMPNAPPQDAI